MNATITQSAKTPPCGKCIIVQVVKHYSQAYLKRAAMIGLMHNVLTVKASKMQTNNSYIKIIRKPQGEQTKPKAKANKPKRDQVKRNGNNGKHSND